MQSSRLDVDGIIVESNLLGAACGVSTRFSLGLLVIKTLSSPIFISFHILGCTMRATV